MFTALPPLATASAAPPALAFAAGQCAYAVVLFLVYGLSAAVTTNYGGEANLQTAVPADEILPSEALGAAVERGAARFAAEALQLRRAVSQSASRVAHRRRAVSARGATAVVRPGLGWALDPEALQLLRGFSVQARLPKNNCKLQHMT